MSEAKFTPGPWKWATSNSWRRLIGDAEYGPHTTFVLVPFVARDGHPDFQISGADMALIEAAPDMYAALRRAREYVLDNRNSLADCHRNFSTGLLEPVDVCSIEDALLFDIDSALAKAAP